MFKSIHITHFRGIRTSDIDNLKRVNLFLGKNNCGKSSVLEAAFLLCGPSNPVLPLTVNTLRGYLGVTENDISLDFYNLSSEDIVIRSTDRSLRIHRFKSAAKDVSLNELGTGNNIQQSSDYHGLQLEYTVDNPNRVYTSSAVIPTESKLHTVRTKTDKRYVESFYAEYIPSNYMQVKMQEKYARIIVQKGNQAIVNVLRTIEPRIKSIQLVVNDIMVDVGLPRLLPINMLGDGIRKIFSILVTIAYCKDGVLLVDEVDNGFHYSAMKTLWKAILTMAKENNVQLFITSHNIDSVKGMLQAYEESPDEQESLSVYKLIKRQDDAVIALRYDYGRVQYMIDQEMELR